MILSVSGARSLFSEEGSLNEFCRLCSKFAEITRSKKVLVATDTRSTSRPILNAISGSITFQGKDVVFLGSISTPALFKESRERNLPAVMITASHNEPEWNGVKFIVSGKGVSESFVRKLKGEPKPSSSRGKITNSESRYNHYFLKKYEGSFKGLRLALDLGGGASLYHVPFVLRSLGCEILTLNGTPGIFARKVDPVSDELKLLSSIVKEEGCDAGFAFDSDGDRLVLVSSYGEKLSGDRMLAIAMWSAMKKEKSNVVVSVDTTLAIRDIASKNKARLFWSKVGESNVVHKMLEEGARLGGEGSSGGMIDSSFNYCRDSLVACFYVLSAVKELGKRAFSIGSGYHQYRIKIEKSFNTESIVQKLKDKFTLELTDGVKVWIDKKTWVLIRKSNTEPVVRVSAESDSPERSRRIAVQYKKIIYEMENNG